MKPGQGWSSWWAWLGLGLLPWLAAGCATHRPQLDRELQARKAAAALDRGVTAGRYVVGCPDVLELAVDSRPDLGGPRPVGPDSRIDLGSAGRLRVEGRTPPEIARAVAEAAGVPPKEVHVRVAEFNSRQVLLFGQVFGYQRAVPYEGPETVLDLLERVGGVTPGAAAEDVYVVRGRVAEARPPLVFHIDLQAIVTGKDLHTNIRLEPSDQVYVGETRRSCLETYVPPCFRTFYEKVCGLYRPNRKAEGPGAGGPEPAAPPAASPDDPPRQPAPASKPAPAPAPELETLPPPRPAYLPPPTTPFDPPVPQTDLPWQAPGR